jgi:ABC-type branched-subunit amino acid transport system substrate-binding protein
MTSATTFDALSMICWAIEQAGSTDPEAINNALNQSRALKVLLLSIPSRERLCSQPLFHCSG